jgi:ketosteroid isomerase-like protein
MTTGQNTDVIRSIYEAFGRGDVDAILARCAEEVDWAADSALDIARGTG